MIGLLIRGAFWFSLVLVMLPIFDRDATDRLKSEDGIEMTDALGAAAGALSYVSDLCNQKPDVCVKGAETISTLGTRAKEGARVAYTYLDGHFAGTDELASPDRPIDPAALARDAEEADAVLTGTIAATEVTIPIPVPRPKG